MQITLNRQESRHSRLEDGKKNEFLQFQLVRRIRREKDATYVRGVFGWVTIVEGIFNHCNIAWVHVDGIFFAQHNL